MSKTVLKGLFFKTNEQKPYQKQNKGLLLSMSSYMLIIVIVFMIDVLIWYFFLFSLPATFGIFNSFFIIWNEYK